MTKIIIGYVAGSSMAEQISKNNELSVKHDSSLAPVYELGYACDFEAGHALHVTWLALRLFDELQDLHGLDAQRRTQLKHAGLLHDIGWLEGRKAHHKKSQQFILHSGILPWDDAHRNIVSCVARYHRKALPKDKHDTYGALTAKDRQIVRALSSLLRVADGLDYQHRKHVRDLKAEASDHWIRIDALMSPMNHIEPRRAERKADLMCVVFNREVVVEAKPTDGATVRQTHCDISVYSMGKHETDQMGLESL